MTSPGSSVRFSGIELPEGHEIRHGELMKRHRHKNSWQRRLVVLDRKAGTLSYYGAKNQLTLGRAANKLSWSLKTSGDGVRPEGSTELKRSLPICNLHACVVDGIDEVDQSRILTISYSEAMGSSPACRGITRSIFFQSCSEDNEDADKDIEEWYFAIKEAKNPRTGTRSVEREAPSLLVEDESGDDDEDDGELPMVHCGWVHKKGSQLNSKWQKRWLFYDVSQARLRYYKGPTEALPQGEIDLEKCHGVRRGMPDLFPETNPPYTFTVQCKDRSYWVRTGSAEATEEWVDILTAYLISTGKERPTTMRTNSMHMARHAAVSDPSEPCPTSPTLRRMTVSLSSTIN